jgi:hypothetical protein
MKATDMSHSMKAQRRRYYLFLLIVLLLLPWTNIHQPQSAYALPKRDGPGEENTCAPEWFVDARLVINGIHLDNKVVRTRPLTIAANSTKLVELRSNCTTALYPLPNNAFMWALTNQPANSSATLTNSNTLTPGLTPDLLGAYTVRFTACPNNCTMQNTTIRPAPFTLTLNAVERIAFPLATEPAPPPTRPATTPSTIPDADEKCLGGGGVSDPQWVTVNQWNGAQDYELLEGKVEKSRISRKDNPLNHDSQDHLMHVRPDPLFRRLLRDQQQVLEIEWERAHLPEPFRATPGDRVSAFGFWILDCGHDGPTEIHPPVGVAVQRPRAVPIPSNALFTLPSDEPIPLRALFSRLGDADLNQTVQASVGSNVYVPGIITDIWFNREAGEVTNNCSTTGLHQPGRYVTGPNGQIIPIQGACIRSPAPLDRVFNFRIYLPPRPKLEFNYDVPIYFEAFSHPFGFSDGPAPQITLAGTDAIPYLEVNIDMRGFTGSRYARQIRAGWVLPAPDNWGLQRWRLRLNAIDVHDDGDSKLRGDGDWRFWLNTNNGLGEWTKLYDCGGCVHGRETFGGRPWQTGEPGDVSADRSLGPDLLRFPNQRIWVHTSGFEADGIIDDDTGAVNDLRLQVANSYRSRSTCTAQTISGCASYTLEYEIGVGPPLPAPTLTAPAQILFDNYGIGPDQPNVGCLPCAESVMSWYPLDTTLQPDQPPVELGNTLLFRSQPSIERHALTDITLTDFTAAIEETRARGPAATATLMHELRAVVDEQLASPLAGEVRDDLILMLDGIPPDLRQQYFGDIKLYSVALPLVQR